MNPGEMSQTRLRAWLAAIIWSVAGVAFLASVFSGGGPGELARDSMRHLAGAGALAFGFFGYWLVLWFTRQRKGRPPLSDERDLQIVARANQLTLVVVLLWVFALTMGLWVANESEGSVPVGWMWFLAYGSVIVAFLVSTVTTLVLDGRVGGHGR
jgi:cytochrome bd-type quinol oxidase subunit 2